MTTCELAGYVLGAGLVIVGFAIGLAINTSRRKP